MRPVAFLLLTGSVSASLRHQRTLGVQPLLELRRVAEIETVQEWPSIHLHRPFEIATRESALESTDVAADHIRIQTHGIHTGKHGLVYRAADGVQQLLQRMPPARLRAVRPEEKEQLITAAALLASRGKHSEQRQSAVLVSVLAEESVVRRASECERPERPKTIASHEANLGREQQVSKEP